MHPTVERLSVRCSRLSAAGDGQRYVFEYLNSNFAAFILSSRSQFRLDRHLAKRDRYLHNFPGSPFKQSYNLLEVREPEAMSTLEKIEAAILTLPSDEFQRLRQWFFDVDYQRWDQQLEQDVANGKLDALAKEAIAEFEVEHCREI